MLITLHYVPLTSLYNLLAHQQPHPQFSLPYIHTLITIFSFVFHLEDEGIMLFQNFSTYLPKYMA
jgi:hypothetical protein